jgi:copper(I)-binding protein
MTFRAFTSLAALSALTLCASAFAHEYQLGELKIGHPYARATVPHQPTGGAYLTIENRGKDGERLVSAASPVAKSVEIHTMSMEGNVMKMRAVPALEIKPGDKVEMQPGHGYHIMLLGLKQALKAGEQFPLTLNFEKAGKLEVSVKVEDIAAKAAAKPAEHKH